MPQPSVERKNFMGNGRVLAGWVTQRTSHCVKEGSRAISQGACLQFTGASRPVLDSLYLSSEDCQCKLLKHKLCLIDCFTIGKWRTFMFMTALPIKNNSMRALPGQQCKVLKQWNMVQAEVAFHFAGLTRGNGRRA